MLRQWGTMAYPFTTRGSSNGSGFPSRLDSKLVVPRWVDKLSRDQAVAAAVHLQRDVGLMETNVDVLDQYALSLQKTASRMIEVCLGSRGFPAEDVVAGSLSPRVRRAAVQMEAMGLWRPSLDPLRLH